MRLRSLTVALVLSAALCSFPAMADILTFSLTASGGGLGSGPFGTVTVSDTGTTGQVKLDIEVTPNQFVLTGSAGQGPTVGFNLNPNVSNLSIVSSSLPNWSLDSASAGTRSFNTFGDFEYSLNCCNNQNGGSHAQTGSEIITLSGTGLTAASFNQLSTSGSPNAYIAVDILSAANGQTGAVGAVNTPDVCVGCTQSTVPEPSSYALFGSVIGILGLTFARRKRFNF